MPIVRTRFQPTVDLDVPEAEAAMLRAQGLLVEAEPDTTEAAATPPAATKTPAASKAAAPEQQVPASDDTKGE